MLHAAVALAELRIPPANRLESLKGDRLGQHSIRINDQWRVCFIPSGLYPRGSARGYKPLAKQHG